MQVKPYKESELGKKEQVRKMFDSIAHRYDFLNHFLSLGIDKTWRTKAVNLIAPARPQQILDVATGTGDFALEAARLDPQLICGLDLSDKMLEAGIKKIQKKNLAHMITMQQGDSEALPFEDNTFDAVTVGFGVRNFENLQKGLEEMLRVAKPGAVFAILEFSKPSTFPFKQIFNFYFNNILPLWGRMFSKDASAYTYLPQSVAAFPEGNGFVEVLNQCGYTNVSIHKLTLGIATIYQCYKER